MGGSCRIYVSKGKYIRLIFLDSLNFLPMRLKEFGGVFNLDIKKEILPYDLYTTENINKVYIPIDECLKYVNEEEQEEYLENCRKWGCINENEIDIIEYSKRYCFPVTIQAIEQ